MAKAKEKNKSEEKKYTKKELQAFISDVSAQVADHNLPSIHTMIALDHALRVSNVRDILDEELKAQARDLWTKIKSSGLHLSDPPILFGYPPLPEDEGDERMDGADSSSQQTSA
ncbi:MAG: hypothetical protein KDD66_11565 [Bdellovibrionales bacterium]|nr:hypothetical protein [Bdellovibrionales bacterium]